MKCKHCGAEIANDSMFCEICGKKVNVKLSVLHTTFIVFLSIYIVVALLLMIIIGYYRTTIILIPSILGASMLVIAIWQKNIALKRKPFVAATPNGEKPAILGRILGIGQLFVGKYRETDGTWVTYLFLCLIFPVFPTGCYRVRHEGQKIGGLGLKNYWTIYGSEKSNPSEILNIYFFYFGFIIWAIFTVLGMISVFA